VKLEHIPSDKLPKSFANYYTELAKRARQRPADAPPVAPQPEGYVSPHWYRRNAVLGFIERVHAATPHALALEIGCGGGGYLEWLSKWFIKVDAYDISSAYVATVPKFANTNIFVQDASKYEPLRTYDLILISEVLEHLVNPVVAIRRNIKHCRWLVASCPIHEELNPDGAFDLDRVWDAKRAGDSTGHIWSMDLEGMVSMFKDYKVLEAVEAGTSGVVLVKGAIP
jgi:2-polyprenyl-3-methyl-5-hydroxy-6-metoxy-1,4-benzoquinol methylase